MNSNNESIMSSDLPESLFARSSSILHSFSTGLIKIPDKKIGQDELILIGSGTFVKIEGEYGILTAHHVTEKLDINSNLGLIVKPEGEEQRNVIRTQFIEIIEIDRGKEDSEGPDLSFIVLPSAKASEIKPYKQFFNLTYHRQAILKNPPRPQTGIWFFCGIPDIDTKEEDSERGYEKVIAYYSYCGAGMANRIYSSGEYDYVEMDIEYKKESQTPLNFGGISGGGLWFVPIDFGSGKEPEASDHILVGVVFYQSALINDMRFVKSHGLVSVYEKAYNFIVGR